MAHPPSLQILARLVHAEAGSRVVEVSVHQGSHWLGSALGEAANAEEAEARALARLLARLESGSGDELVPGPVETPPGETPPLEPSRLAPAQAARPQEPPPATPVAAKHPLSRPGGAVPRPVPLPPDVGTPAEHPPAMAPVPEQAGPEQARAGQAGPGQAGVEPTGPERRSAEETPAGPPPAELPPPAEPPPDPEDWSAELARLDLELRRLGWSREQEATYLQRAFGHPSRSRLTSYADLSAYLAALEALAVESDPSAAPVPLRRRDLLLQGEQLLERLGWSGEQGRRFLQEQLGATSRQRLNESQLLHFNMLLEGVLLERGAGAGAGV